MNTNFSSGLDGEYSADRLGRIKVLLVGNPGSGKTSLAHLLANAAPLTRSQPTIGCNASLLVMKYPHDRAKQFPNLAGQDFFLELWDVGAHPRYQTMRGLFYQGVNGVILVHDLTFSRSLPSLQRWAAEVSQLGTFQAPYSEDRAGLNLGGLPVPCLMVGNKLDLLGKHRGRYSRTWHEQLWAALQRPFTRLRGCLEVVTAALRGYGGGEDSRACPTGSGRLGGCGGGSLPKESLLHGNLQASATRGDIDMHAVTSFFCTLIERRYCPSSPSLAEAAEAHLAAAAAHLAAGAEGGGGTALPAIVTRLSGERLPPVMYNAISEESSPYASLNHTPFSSCASLHRAAGGGGSGNLAPWLPPVPRPHSCSQHQGHGQPGLHQGRQQQQPSALDFPGVSVAFKLRGGGAGLQAQLDLGGKGDMCGAGAGTGGHSVRSAGALCGADPPPQALLDGPGGNWPSRVDGEMI